jgi:L-threonylcarbamoyladenylate synthase
MKRGKPATKSQFEMRGVYMTTVPFTKKNIKKAVTLLQHGGVIAYPTEGVYGLGCDPFNGLACQRLSSIKERPSTKAFVLVASDFKQIESLIDTIQIPDLDSILATWPGAVTWVFPASSNGMAQLLQTSLAIRISAHPVVRALCHAFGKPIISTSANLSTETPLLNITEVQKQFENKVDLIIDAELGNLSGPTPIYDALTKKILRKENPYVTDIKS